MKKISINLKINKGEILNELTRRSSYTALSVSPTIGEDNGIVDKLVLSSDDYPWSRDKLRMVFYKLRDILLPYSSGGDEFADENETEFSFKVTIGAGCEDSVIHYMKETIIAYILSQWYLDKINEKAAYLAMQCDDMITLLKMTLNKALGRTRRPTNYF
ncbi:MAG: hypothetical protein E7083_06485 [Bacteroidales bacterium]|nr:hypothetical protein [Bacteroidales bacterium]